VEDADAHKRHGKGIQDDDADRLPTGIGSDHVRHTGFVPPPRSPAGKQPLEDQPEVGDHDPSDPTRAPAITRTKPTTNAMPTDERKAHCTRFGRVDESPRSGVTFIARQYIDGFRPVSLGEAVGRPVDEARTRPGAVYADRPVPQRRCNCLRAGCT